MQPKKTDRFQPIEDGGKGWHSAKQASNASSKSKGVSTAPFREVELRSPAFQRPLYLGQLGSRDMRFAGNVSLASSMGHVNNINYIKSLDPQHWWGHNKQRLGSGRQRAVKGEAGTELADGARRTEASSGVPAASPQSKVPSGWHTKPGQNWSISVEGNAWLIPNRLLNTEKSPRNLLAALHLWAGLWGKAKEKLLVSTLSLIWVR